MDFKRARTTAKRIRQERMLLFVYAISITAALLIYVHHNNNVNASFDYDNEFVDEQSEEIAMGEESFSLEENLALAETGAEIEDLQVIEAEPELEHAEEILVAQNLGVNEEAITVEKGDSFIGILTKMGLEYNEATNLYKAYKKVYDARTIKVGQVINVSSVVDTKYSDMMTITKIMTEPTSGTRYILEKQEDGKYEARVEQDEMKSEVKAVSGLINGTVVGSMKLAGVPQNVAGNFVNIFSYSVDFRRDVKAGDKFEVRYERKVAPNGNVVKTGDIVYAALTLGKVKTELYRFEDGASVDYFNEKGLALKKTLDRKPLEYKKARISSKFGRRFHPILKQYRMHSGVDYAAPMNTKVFASADGTVTAAKWVNGYGNYITIRHNSEYSTGYGHLKSYAKGIRPGVRVKQGQVIAYVGSTGRSTGPHLHFEIIKNGKKIDPLKVKAATGENLSGDKLKKFKKVVEQIKADMAGETKVAEKTDKEDKTASN